MDLSKLVQQFFGDSTFQSEPLDGGLSNINTLLTLASGERFVVRTPHHETEHLFNRQQEAAVLAVIKPLNLTSECLHINPHNGIKISRYLENAVPFSQSTWTREQKIASVATLLSTLHHAKLRGFQSFHPFEKLRQYQQLASTSSLSFSDPYLEQRMEKHWNSVSHILCHNDLVDGNLLFTASRAYLIDYEYAGANDPVFDLASFLSENNFVGDELIHLFLTNYYGRIPTACEREQVLDWIHFQDLLWGNWALGMYELYQTPIYLQIYQEKVTRFHQWKEKINR